jgi:hypothetical protein
MEAAHEQNTKRPTHEHAFLPTAGDMAELLCRGRPLRIGAVDTVIPDGSGFWLAADGLGTRLYVHAGILTARARQPRDGSALPGEVAYAEPPRRGPFSSVLLIGSACRSTTSHVPSSLRKTVVTRRVNGVASARPETFAVQCSTSWRMAVLSDTRRYRPSYDLHAPSRKRATAKSRRASASDQPRTAEWVGKDDVVAVGVQLFDVPGVAFGEGIQCVVILSKGGVEVHGASCWSRGGPPHSRIGRGATVELHICAYLNLQSIKLT